MNIYDFYAALAKHCGIDKCEGCGARAFCYTAPLSMTDELIRQTVVFLQGGKPVPWHGCTVYRTDQDHHSEG